MRVRHDQCPMEVEYFYVGVWEGNSGYQKHVQFWIIASMVKLIFFLI